MFARTHGGTTLGVDGLVIDVEVDSSAGLPGFDLVGLANTAVRESKERVRTAIRNSGINLQQKKVTVNLAPAGIRKDSAGLDLPIAIALLAAYGIIPAERIERSLFASELSLEGDCRAVQGILPITITAREQGYSSIFVACDNANEALLVDGITVYGIQNLHEAIAFLTGKTSLSPSVPNPTPSVQTVSTDDFADVQGQFQAKRALEIAAAGGHNVLMVGVPGSGKTMLARRVSSILPPLTREEALDITKIYSIAGLLPQNGGLVQTRPFRSPHHTASTTAMIGGGSVPRPGEVTLAHHGVLFLDELPEFSKSTLEVLRQPLEDKKICISRINASIVFPSDIMLVCAMNPCPCGYYGDESQKNECICSPNEIRRYTRKISGPLLDRIDIHIRIPHVAYKDLVSTKNAESSAVIAKRVEAARAIQQDRLAPCSISCNAQMNHAMLKRFCPLSKDAQSMLEMAFHRFHLSARSYDRTIKVARTISDLDTQMEILPRHIAEAIQLRHDAGLSDL